MTGVFLCQIFFSTAKIHESTVTSTINHIFKKERYSYIVFKKECYFYIVSKQEETRFRLVSNSQVRKDKAENNNVAEEELFYILDLFEYMRVTYWLDGSWGVDVLTGKQQREHRDIDVDFDAQRTRKIIQELEGIEYKIEVDWMPSRVELRHEEYGYLDVHPINLNDGGSITQANPEGGNYVFQDDWFSEINYKDRKMPCILREAQLLFHSGYDLTETDHFDMKNSKSVT